MHGHVDCGIIVVTTTAPGISRSYSTRCPAAADGLRTRCVVVDNNSSDETMSIVRSRTDVIAVEAGRNLGYAGAINLGRA